MWNNNTYVLINVQRKCKQLWLCIKKKPENNNKMYKSYSLAYELTIADAGRTSFP